jgi:hypothetical protein
MDAPFANRPPTAHHAGMASRPDPDWERTAHLGPDPSTSLGDARPSPKVGGPMSRLLVPHGSGGVTTGTRNLDTRTRPRMVGLAASALTSRFWDPAEWYSLRRYLNRRDAHGERASCARWGWHAPRNQSHGVHQATTTYSCTGVADGLTTRRTPRIFRVVRRGCTCDRSGNNVFRGDRSPRREYHHEFIKPWPSHPDCAERRPRPGRDHPGGRQRLVCRPRPAPAIGKPGFVSSPALAAASQALTVG